MKPDPFSLDGKRILVTGASSGLGRAIAIACSQRGAAIVATGRDEARLHETIAALYGAGHVSVCADLVVASEREQVTSAAGTIAKAADMMMDRGAASVRAVITHPVLSGKAYENIEKSALTELIVTDTLPLREETKKIKALLY